jgi:hypothetical protein
VGFLEAKSRSRMIKLLIRVTSVFLIVLTLFTVGLQIWQHATSEDGRPGKSDGSLR